MTATIQFNKLTLRRWIFILEGILTVLVAVLAYFTLYDFPETASFLTEEERAFVVYRLKYQGASDTTINGVRVAQDDTFQWKFVTAAFLDWQIWTNIWVYWGMFSELLSMFVANMIRYCMSPVRHFAFLALHHPRTGLHVIHCATADRTNLHHRVCARNCCSMVERSCRQAISFHPGVSLHHGCWVCYVCGKCDPRCHLRRCIHCSMRSVSRVPRKHHLAV